ncbi:N-acyl-D-amino-acid deacylase family protein [Flavisphingomonas formosensis]|uniref:N-acyl-D-amino-acid deacylase family protein n=1 Tax=Flavisphingomonas formosensis TaxID=861534 RepID=UPI0012F9756E|nr:amidohydrolase family protein [Sphingomonas formosensis]
MTAHYDLIVRNGLVHDGMGGEPVRAGVAVKDGRIAAVGAVTGGAAEEIDASGCIVTPGFVDIHTHYDGHATWAERLYPSSNHGVTTAVMGNCGVGFAPCRPDDRDKLIALMEGVEDIPGIVMTEGLPWKWEDFPSYLDFLAGRRFDMDVAAYLPHAPLRLYVMGERAMSREPATDADIAEMARLAREAVEAGALGFATSRSINHKASDGRLTPSYSAAEGELTGIAGGLAAAGQGIFQAISDFDEPEADFAMLRRVAEGSGRRMTFSLLQMRPTPDRWRTVLAAAEQARAEGMAVTAQVCGRPVGLLAGLELSVNPFSFCPAYREIADLPFEERLAALREPARRAAITGQYPCRSWEPVAAALTAPEFIFELTDRLDYEPRPDDSMASQAARRGAPAAEHMFDRMVSGDGRHIFYIPAANFVGNSIEAVETMMRSDVTVPGLGDGGAHCGSICDASLPTYNLLRWTGEEAGKLSLAGMIRSLSWDCARAVDLNDRGRIAVGLRADLNVIDLDRLSLGRPHMIYDLPIGGGRLTQEARGFVATIVNGEVTYREGVATGRLPGRLVRGTRPVAAA